MDIIPDHSGDFFAALWTSLSRRRVARLFARLGWSVRKCSWTDYEVCSPFAELVIEAESPILLHGPVADAEAESGGVCVVVFHSGAIHRRTGPGGDAPGLGSDPFGDRRGPAAPRRADRRAPRS
jgi:hypothetical protein